MKRSALLLLGTLMLGACSGGGESEVITITSAQSERGWVENCRVTADIMGDYPAACTGQPVVWAVTYLSRETPAVFIGRLGTPTDSLRAEVSLQAPLDGAGSDLINDIVFVRGIASAGRTRDGQFLVRIEDATFLGSQTKVDGPRQSDAAPDLTLAEFGALCLDITDVMFANRCTGRRVVWYAIYEGPMITGEQVLRLPFEDNRFAAQLSLIEPANWRVDPINLSGQLVVIEGRIGERVVRDETRVPYLPLTQGHIIGFPRVGRPVVELTGVE